MEFPKKIVLYGGTGLARMLRQTIEENGSKLIAIVDDTPDLDTLVKNVPLFRGWDKFQESDLYSGRKEYGFLLSIGNPDSRLHRYFQKTYSLKPYLYNLLVSEGLTPTTIRHKFSYVADDAIVGEGTLMNYGSGIMAQAKVGKSCTIGINTTVSHDAQLCDFVDATAGVMVCGEAVVEDHVLLGAGSIILPRVRVGTKAMIGAGAVVTKDVPPDKIAKGVPAKFYSKQRSSAGVLYD